MKKAELMELYAWATGALMEVDAAADPEKAAAVSRLLAVLQFAAGAHGLLQEILRCLRMNAPFPPGLDERLERALA